MKYKYNGYYMSDEEKHFYDIGAYPKSKWTKGEIKEYYQTFSPFNNEDISRFFKFKLSVLKEVLLTKKGEAKRYLNTTTFYVVDEKYFYEFTPEELINKLKQKSLEIEEYEEDKKEREKSIQKVKFWYSKWNLWTNRYDSIQSIGYLKGDWIYFNSSCRGKKRKLGSKGLYYIFLEGEQ